MSLILIASVGGSPNPIASAIAAKRPDLVLFLATEGCRQAARLGRTGATDPRARAAHRATA